MQDSSNMPKNSCTLTSSKHGQNDKGDQYQDQEILLYTGMIACHVHCYAVCAYCCIYPDDAPVQHSLPCIDRIACSMTV